MTISFKKLYPDAVAPTRARDGDAGFDLTCHTIEDTETPVLKFRTGIAVEIPTGYFGLLRPRSSICKTGYLMASSGVIDSGYRGEIMIPLRYIWHPNAVRYQPGDRVCQLIILPLPQVHFVEVQELSPSERGDGGFGSTGK